MRSDSVNFFREGLIFVFIAKNADHESILDIAFYTGCPVSILFLFKREYAKRFKYFFGKNLNKKFRFFTLKHLQFI